MISILRTSRAFKNLIKLYGSLLNKYMLYQMTILNVIIPDKKTHPFYQPLLLQNLLEHLLD